MAARSEDDGVRSNSQRIVPLLRTSSLRSHLGGGGLGSLGGSAILVHDKLAALELLAVEGGHGGLGGGGITESNKAVATGPAIAAHDDNGRGRDEGGGVEEGEQSLIRALPLEVSDEKGGHVFDCFFTATGGVG